LLIENIHSNRESVRKILDGFAPENDEESRIYCMKKGLDFIAEPENKITEEKTSTSFICFQLVTF
jgi:hypothetical protein